MSRRAAIIAIAVAIVISSLAGFWLGVREGWLLALYADAAPRGAMAIGIINELDRGTPERLKIFFESDIDMGLIGFNEVNKSRLRDALDPIWGISVYPHMEDYVVRLATYRKAHPSPMKLDSLPANASDDARKLQEDILRAHQENERVIAELVARYARKQ